jgi:hypothetical protein
LLLRKVLELPKASSTGFVLMIFLISVSTRRPEALELPGIDPGGPQAVQGDWIFADDREREGLGA